MVRKLALPLQQWRCCKRGPSSRCLTGGEALQSTTQQLEAALQQLAMPPEDVFDPVNTTTWRVLKQRTEDALQAVDVVARDLLDACFRCVDGDGVLLSLFIRMHSNVRGDAAFALLQALQDEGGVLLEDRTRTLLLRTATEVCC